VIDHNTFARPESNESPCLEHVLYWVWERETIRIAKENNYKGELTTDPILSKYKFCNVRRQDDRVSKWIIDNMLVHASPEDDDIWFISAIARYVNWPPMLHELLSEGLVPSRVEDFDYKKFGECIDDVTRAGGKAWAGSYMTFPAKVIAGQAKGAATAQHILAPLKNRAYNIRKAIASNRLENAFNAMVGAYGWQPFMCGQVCADLSYVEPLCKAIDLKTWAPLGPGSQRGLSRLDGLHLQQRWFQGDFNRRLIEVMDTIQSELDIDCFSLHNVQNVMCECDKMWRVLYGEGRPRSIYKPEIAF